MLRCTAVCVTLVGVLSASVRSAAAQAPADATAFVAADSTLVVLVPASADAIGVLGAVRALSGVAVAAVYTTDDPAARHLARALSETVGGSLLPYDRAGKADNRYAALLVRNAVGANPDQAVVVVVAPSLVGPLYRHAAAAAGIDVGPTGAPGGRPNGVLVLSIAPNSSVLVRARY